MKEEQSPQYQFDIPIVRYYSPSTLYSLAFSNRPQTNIKLAIGSLVHDGQNIVSILRQNQYSQIEERFSFAHQYPPTKILFVPDEIGNIPDLVATSAEIINIWKIDDNGVASHCLKLQSHGQFAGPLPSFDWNPRQNQIIGTVSIDATCSIWNVQKGQLYTQFIPHQGQAVYDIHFSNNKNIFCTGGSDKTVRQFDLRDLNEALLLYKGNNPILKLRYNRNETNSNLVAFIEDDMTHLSIIDARRPIIPVMRLDNHSKYVNALAWAPKSSNHICTVSDDKKVFIWNLTNKEPQVKSPELQYGSIAQITNMAWSADQNKIAICSQNLLQVLRL